MRIIKGLLILLLCIMFLVPIASAQTFPKPGGYVNDFAKLYSDTYTMELEQRLQAFEASTSAEVVVVTVNDLQDTPIDDYAVRLFENWKIGKDKQDNGLLFLIAKEEREVRIEVGYGLESVVTDARAGRIIRDSVVPAFKDGDYESGTTEGITTLEKYIRGESVPEAVPDKDTGWSGLLEFIPFLFFGFVYLGSFLARSKSFYAGGIIGSIIGVLIGIIMGSFAAFLIGSVLLGIVGLILDFLLSKNYENLKKAGKDTGWWHTGGGFGGGRSGGGFGGFGGGSSGGGGASGRW